MIQSNEGKVIENRMKLARRYYYYKSLNSFGLNPVLNLNVLIK